MSPKNKCPIILMTGAGGPAVPTIITHLKKTLPGCKVIAGDMSEHAVGFLFADQGVVLPPGGAPNFLKKINKIIKEWGINFIISVVDEELEKLGTLDDRIVTVIQPNTEFIKLCLNKEELFQKLNDLGLKVPESFSASKRNNRAVNFPVILKPKIGRGSRGIAIARNPQELEDAIARSLYKDNDLLIQRFIVGVEFTVSMVAWRDSVLKAVVPKEVLLKQGSTRSARTVRNKSVIDYCKEIHSLLNPRGPYNIQLILEEITGQPYLIEINPRYSTTSTLTIKSGVDEVGGVIKLSLGEHEDFNSGKFEEGVYMIRRVEDIYRTADEVNQLKIVDEYK